MQMVKELIFATTNKNKLKEAESILEITIIATDLEVEEIQSLDPEKVIRNKALAYYDQIRKPLFVEDTSLTFEALGDLPGTYINDFSKSLGNEGLIKLLNNYENRKAYATVTIGYIYAPEKIEINSGTITGLIAESPRGEEGFGWDPIFIPDGTDKTFAQMSLAEKNKYSMRVIALNKFHDWLLKNS